MRGDLKKGLTKNQREDTLRKDSNYIKLEIRRWLSAIGKFEGGRLGWQKFSMAVEPCNDDYVLRERGGGNKQK